MSAGTIVAIVVVVIIVAALIVVASLAARRRRLQQRFGPEYDLAVEGSDSRLKAEAELAEREKRVKGLDIRPLDLADRASYLSQWTAIQQEFVDSPADAVAAGQALITSVMADRGYPTEDVEQITADLSVDHASTLGHFRTAQDISGRVAEGTASTEDLRQAMVHYRALFTELLGEAVDGETPHDPTQPVTAAPVAPAAAADDLVTRPASGPDYAEAEAIAAQPDVTQPDPPLLRPAGRHHAGRSSAAANGDSGGELDGDDAGPPDLADADDAEPAAASRFPWRK